MIGFLKKIGKYIFQTKNIEIFKEWEQFLLHNYNKPNQCMESIVNKTKFKKILNLIQCSMKNKYMYKD